jgi:DNA invertase Pin-like site-specific DNA recombinase
MLGDARVSTADQQPHLQVDDLERAGGTLTNRPTLEQILDLLRPGDSLVVWKLDRLGRSLRHRVDIVTGLAARGVGFRSLQEQVDTTSPGGTLVFPVFAALAEFERTSSASAPALGWPPPATRPPRAAAGRRR